MPGTELSTQFWADRERQKAGGGGNPIALHDHRAVVQRRTRMEDARHQVVGHHGVERNPTLDVVSKAYLSLDDDECARPLGRQVGGGDDDLFERLIRAPRPVEVPEKRGSAEVRQGAANIGLEKYDDRDHDVSSQTPDDPVDRFQLQPPREKEQADRKPPLSAI